MQFSNRTLLATSNLLHFPELFFWMGAFSAPHNPVGFPDTFPFTLLLDERTGLWSQKNTDELKKLLRKTYSFGSTVGNAMDDSPLGKAYCDDFLIYLKGFLFPGCKILEIGAGRAYLSSRLIRLGYNVTAIEPGDINRKFWKKYQVDVIQDVFPSKKASGPYDVIVLYGVLEHLADCEMFLHQVRDHLSPNGIVVLSVPNCMLEIEYGDPSMLLHEHFQYFTSSSLFRTLQSAGYDVNTQPSGYGRSIYASARLQKGKTVVGHPSSGEIEIVKAYPRRVNELLNCFSSIFEKVNSAETFGIYCPARALALLPRDASIRFFDDSPDLHGKYYPPFRTIIESREDLLKNPVDTLFVISRTFGDKLKKELDSLLPYTTSIYTIVDMERDTFFL